MSSLLLLLFIIYSLLIFFINNLLVILCLLIIQLVISIFLKINNLKMLKYLLSALPFITMVFLSNWIFSSINLAIIVSIRLLIVVHATYIISTIYKPLLLANSIKNLFIPFKLFKINIDNIAMIIAISISMIPILIEEAKQIKLSLLAKGFKFSLKNIFTKPHIYVLTYINNIFKRVDELEITLSVKGYNL